MRIGILIIITSFFFVRCYTPSYKKEINSLDSINSVINQTLAELNKIDTNIIDNNYKTFIINMNRLSKLKQKSLSGDKKLMIDEYSSLGGMFFKTYKMQYKGFIKDITASTIQLNNLKDDLTNGRMPKSTFDSYYRNEKKSANAIIQSILIYTKYTNNYIKKFEDLNPKISVINTK